MCLQAAMNVFELNNVHVAQYLLIFLYVLAMCTVRSVWPLINFVDFIRRHGLFMVTHTYSGSLFPGVISHHPGD